MNSIPATSIPFPVGGTELEALACVDLDGIEETAADELAGGDDRRLRPDILLNEPDAVDRARLARRVEKGRKRINRLEQLHAGSLATPVRLEDEGAHSET